MESALACCGWGNLLTCLYLRCVPMREPLSINIDFIINVWRSMKLGEGNLKPRERNSATPNCASKFILARSWRLGCFGFPLGRLNLTQFLILVFASSPLGWAPSWISYFFLYHHPWPFFSLTSCPLWLLDLKDPSNKYRSLVIQRLNHLIVSHSKICKCLHFHVFVLTVSWFSDCSKSSSNAKTRLRILSFLLS